MTPAPVPARDFVRMDRHRQGRRSGRPSPARTRFLLAFKVALLATGAGSLALFLLWNSPPPAEPAISVGGEGPSVPRNEMAAPRLVGLDDNGRRYVISARRVVENHGAESLVHLDELRTSFYARDGSEVSLSAGNGLYDVSKRRVALEGGIQMNIQPDTVLETDSSMYDVGQGFVRGDSPVRVRGPWGDLEAKTFRYEPVRGLLELTGRPVLRIRKPTRR